VAFAPNFFSAIFGPAIGKLADLYGRSVAWVIGFAGLIFSLAVCAWATSIWMLIAGRVLSGLAVRSTLKIDVAHDISIPRVSFIQRSTLLRWVRNYGA
jgi:MFS family permease